MRLTLTLPLPPRCLSSNADYNPFTYTRETKQARQDGNYALREAQGTAGLIGERLSAYRWRVSLVFGTKGARLQGRYAPRDESNAVASFKAYQDGIFDGLGLDDSAKHCEMGTVRIDPKAEAGVVVTLEAIDALS